MSGAGVRRIIYVAAEHKKTLAAIAASVTGLAYAQKHQEVKRQLQANNIPHGDFEGQVSQVPDNHHYWHA